MYDQAYNSKLPTVNEMARSEGRRLPIAGLAREIIIGDLKPILMDHKRCGEKVVLSQLSAFLRASAADGTRRACLGEV